MSTATRDDIASLVRDGAKYRQKRSKWERFWIRFFVELVLAPLRGLTFMLAVGLVHHQWWPSVPTIGFWWALLVVALLRSALVNSAQETSRS